MHAADSCDHVLVYAPITAAIASDATKTFKGSIKAESSTIASDEGLHGPNKTSDAFSGVYGHQTSRACHTRALGESTEGA